MTVTRRDFLKLGGLTATALTMSSCSALGRKLAQDELPVSLSAPLADTVGPPAGGLPVVAVDPVWRFLNRAGYGPRPGDLERVRKMGLETYLAEQLEPETIDDTVADLLVRNLTYYHQTADQLISQDMPREVSLDLAVATVGRAVYSHRQLQEAMVEFWSDHFNIYLRKTQFMLPLKVVDDREVIRPHALGKFRDLLSASAHSPAMLVYLDNVRNTKEAPNENYARELLELHTLGVDAGYSQQDVEEVARALTGWGVHLRGLRRGQFNFFPERHDQGAKQILGHDFPAGQGADDVDQLLEILVSHPATAAFIATKLVRRFVTDVPPPALVEQVAAVYRSSDGDIKEMLRTIFLSEEFAAAPPKMKRPYTFMVSALRTLNSDISRYRALIPWLERLGQLPFHWAAPDGYPDESAAWASNLLPRWNFSQALVTGRLEGSQPPFEAILQAGKVTGVDETLNLFAGLTLGRALDSEAAGLFLDYVGGGRLTDRETRQRLGEAVALMLASPAFQWT